METIALLAERHIALPGLATGLDIEPGALSAAVAELGLGLEHLSGERAVAIAPPVVVTDRRLLWMAGDRPYASRLDQLSPAMVPPELAGFIASLAELPPQGRVAHPRALVAPLPSDPTGALGALGELHRSGRADDGRAEQLLCLVEASVRRGSGMDAQAGADLACRAVLLDRTLTWGRGSHLTFWLSPLTVDDFAHAIGLVFGEPQRRFRDPQGFVSLTFRAHDHNVHVRIVPVGSLSGFSIQLTYGSSFMAVPAEETRRVTRFAHESLVAYEAQLLLLRTLYGWQSAAPQLLAASPQTVGARMRELVDWCELAPFLSAPAWPTFDDPTEAAVPAELAMTPEERAAHAREAWQRAVARGERAAMIDAAEQLQRAQAWEDGARAYALLGERFEDLRGSAAAGVGDCILYSVYARAGTPREDRVEVLQTALAWYDSALRHGCPRDRVEESYWSACELLLAAHEGHRLRQLEALSRYQSTFPDGLHREDANMRLASLSP